MAKIRITAVSEGIGKLIHRRIDAALERLEKADATEAEKHRHAVFNDCLAFYGDHGYLPTIDVSRAFWYNEDGDNWYA